MVSGVQVVGFCGYRVPTRPPSNKTRACITNVHDSCSHLDMDAMNDVSRHSDNIRVNLALQKDDYQLWQNPSDHISRRRVICMIFEGF